MSIFEVRHQPRAQRILQRALTSDRLPHAYIFHGPEGVGKRTLAREFARMLLCGSPASTQSDDEYADEADSTWRDACGACEDCRLVTAGTHPDMQEVQKTLNRYHSDPTVRARKAIDLGVDVVRQFVIDRAGERPSRGRARVFVVLDADQMSTAAQNALLKTLEEPPGASFLILVSRSLDRLLPTTRSRCQPVPFVNLPRDFVEGMLLERLPELDDDQRRFLAGHSDGRLGVALRHAASGLLEARPRLFETIAGLGTAGPSELAKVVQEDAGRLADALIQAMIAAGEIDRAAEASRTEPTRRGLMDMLALVSSLLRDVLQVHGGREDHVVNRDQERIVQRLAERMGLEAAAQAVRDVYKTETDIAANANVALALETLGIRLLRRMSDAPRRAAESARG